MVEKIGDVDLLILDKLAHTHGLRIFEEKDGGEVKPAIGPSGLLVKIEQAIHSTRQDLAVIADGRNLHLDGARPSDLEFFVADDLYLDKITRFAEFAGRVLDIRVAVTTPETVRKIKE